MGCPSTIELGKNITFTCQLLASDGTAVDADGTVSYNVYEEETSTAIVTGTMTKLGAITGLYTEKITCSTANGYEQDKTYSIRISAAIGGITTIMLYTFQVFYPTVYLAATGLDVVAITEPAGVASNFREMVVQLWRRFFGKTELNLTDGELKTYKADGVTVATTQAVSETSTLQSQGEST